MRRVLAVTLLAVLAAVPASAQFQGTVTMKMTPDKSKGDIVFTISVDGDRSATVVTMPASAGPMAGMEVRSIFDPRTNTITSLVPLPPGMAQVPMFANAKGIKTVTNLSKAPAGGASTGDVKKLGTSETLLGMSCDDYEVSSSNGTSTRVCMTTALGRFVMPQMNGGMGRSRGESSDWTKAFGNKPVFPLKVWTTDGKMTMEVTAVQKGHVPASVFDIPDGYVDMAAMRGGRP